MSGKNLTVREKIALFPHSPGGYRYYDASGKVIYVGKAKDLHKRVAQYFVPPERLNVKTRLLVSKIADAQFSVVDSEADALLLENNLIKQYKPRYNILLKDSKTYPWIVITNDEFPKIYLTRRVDRKNGTYFGPYSSVSQELSSAFLQPENHRRRDTPGQIPLVLGLPHRTLQRLLCGRGQQGGIFILHHRDHPSAERRRE